MYDATYSIWMIQHINNTKKQIQCYLINILVQQIPFYHLSSDREGINALKIWAAFLKFSPSTLQQAKNQRHIIKIPFLGINDRIQVIRSEITFFISSSEKLYPINQTLE